MKKLLLLALISAASINAQNATVSAASSKPLEIDDRQEDQGFFKIWQDAKEYKTDEFGSNLEEIKTEIKNKINNALETVKATLNKYKTKIDDNQIRGLMSALKSYANNARALPHLEDVTAEIYRNIRDTYKKIAESDRKVTPRAGETLRLKDTNIGIFNTQLEELFANHNNELTTQDYKDAYPLGKPMEDIVIEKGEMTILPIDLNK